MNRCAWVTGKSARYLSYHDDEWGRPVHDDGHLFEMLILEGFQAGLSWECVLNKRDAFRTAFDGFDPQKVAAYGEEKKAALLADPAIIRNRRKIDASVTNAQAFLRIQRECGSFSAFLWGFTDGVPVREPYTLRTTSSLSDAVSKELVHRGMKFVGSTIIYSFLQAVGVINGHGDECDLGKE